MSKKKRLLQQRVARATTVEAGAGPECSSAALPAHRALIELRDWVNRQIREVRRQIEHATRYGYNVLANLLLQREAALIGVKLKVARMITEGRGAGNDEALRTGAGGQPS